VSPIAGALLDRGSRVALMLFDYLVASTFITMIGVLSLLHSLPTGCYSSSWRRHRSRLLSVELAGGPSIQSSCRARFGIARMRLTRARTS